MRALFEELGLTAYEATALDHLVRHGARTGPDLSRETSIPFGRIYDVLNTLVERGLATVAAGRPKLYTATDTQDIPSRLLASNRRRLQDEEARLEARVRQLSDGLAGLGRRLDPPGHSYGLRLGEEAGRERLIEATHAATERVVAYLSFEQVQEEDMHLFDAFRQAVGRGIVTRILLRARDVDYLMTTPYVDTVLDAMLPHLGQTLQVRLTWDESPAFAALDGRHVVLGLRNPIDPSLYFGVVSVDDTTFALGLEAKFDGLWGHGEEPKDLVQWALGRKGGRALLKWGAKVRDRGGKRDD